MVCVNHNYDRAGNRTYRDTLVPGLDELYSYDGMNRLTFAERGTLNGGLDAITSKTFAEQWGLDATGNWLTFNHDVGGVGWDMMQTRGHNVANEIESIDTWVNPVHDRAGNMTTVPKPSDPVNSGLTCKYDAWNRLVQVTDDATVVAKYEYDGQNRRVKKHFDSQSPDDGCRNGLVF